MRGLRRKGRPSRLKLDICAVLAVASVLSWTMAPPASAKVNPLVVIQRQIHKANMLVVLDTSGSMTGVPGGTFYYKAEAGVDCDDGYDCRQAGLIGTCTVSGKSCYSDEDCQRPTCQLTPSKFCKTDTDCMPSDKICSVTGDACSDTKPCPSNKGKCAATGGICETDNQCPGTCSNCPTVPCSSIGSACPNPIGTCAEDTSKVCTGDTVCPQKAAGNCAQGGTPPSGCSDHSDCPTKQKCANTDETCRTTTECPGQKKGRCSLSGETCNNNNNCDSNETCVYWTNPCVGPPNPCDKSYTTCTLCTDTSAKPNMCVQTYNTCVIAANNCIPVASNPCVTPSAGDVCGPSTVTKKGTGTPGPIRMCRISQTVCASNKDCDSGDTCGPATSRMVIAKRAISTVMNSSYEMVNFGLMTFYQGGYYPYFQMVGGTTGTVTEFVTKDRLLEANCWIPSWGPSVTCPIAGMTMKLRLMQNSRYTVNTGTAFVEAEDNFCGDTCDIKGVGPGVYVGSFYQYDGVEGGNATASQVMSSYTDKTIKIGTVDYTYYEAQPDYYNGGMPPPFTFTDCETTGVCGAHCGGRWDTDLSNFIDTSDDPNTALANVKKINARLEKASYGGLLAYWSTPTGCTLENDSAAASPNNSAYNYMETLKAGDSIACRENFILLITDGAANGPGDIDASGNSLCDVAACAEDDPVAAGCQCRSVLATYHLRKNLGVKTFVIGFSGDAAAASPRAINENMAHAGGTDAGGDGAAPYSFLAQNEAELVNVIQMAVFDAVRGSYSTAPTSTSAGTQQATTVAEGRFALDSRMDFPEWKGHLIAYDLGGTTPVIAWDAYTQLAAMNWKTRRVYTWDGTNMVKIQVDPTSGAIVNKAALATLGLGADATDAEKVARWALGDPTYKNPAILGAIINSTPIDIAGPGDIPMPGGHEFYLAHKDRPHLVYVGSSDGMLHAFFLEQTTLGTTTYPAGSEAFAFIPPEMLPVIKRLYAQGGQKTDPYHHIFGLADSPKAKTMCVSGCADATTAVWKTVLIMPEGYGGSETFMLDVTSPFTSTGVADPPVTVRWHTGHGSSASDYDSYLGNTISLPAFFMNKTPALNDYRVVFASGYAVDPNSPTQGRVLVTASASTGTVINAPALLPDVDCGRPYAALTDVATARDFGKDQNNRLLAAYFGDTAGRLWRYTLVSTMDHAAYDFGCDYPLHFSPTIVQLDRDDFNSSHAREIYPVVVTNSNLDFDTSGPPPSQMIFLKETAQVDTAGNVTGVVQDTTWNGSGKIVLTVGNDSEICGVTYKDPTTKQVTCTTSMPLAARPTSTPLGLLRSDASGFQVMTMWYVPAADGCTKGTTYLTIHEMVANQVGQLLGAAVAQEPVTSPVVLRGHIYLFGSSGAYDITDMASDTVVTTGRAIEPTSVGGNFTRFNWTELFD